LEVLSPGFLFVQDKIKIERSHKNMYSLEGDGGGRYLQKFLEFSNFVKYFETNG
jgi:hypothetical protein